MIFPPAYVQTFSLSPLFETPSLYFLRLMWGRKKHFFSHFNLHIFRHEMERQFLNPVVACTPRNFNLFSLLRVRHHFYTHGNINTEYSFFNFHIRTVHLDIIEVFLLTNECTSDCLKNNIKIYLTI